MNLQQAYKFHGSRDTAMKFGDTLLYNSQAKQWEWLRDVGNNVIYFAGLGTNFSIRETAPVGVSEMANYALHNPVNGYYNFRTNRQAYILKRIPSRQTKQTCYPERNTSLFSPFWKKLPRSIRSELVSIFTLTPENDPFIFYMALLNANEGYASFNQALDEVVSNSMLSYAISRTFAVSMSFMEDAYNIMYLDNEVGLIDLASKKIHLTSNVVHQELSDLFRDTNVKWQLVPAAAA